MVYKENDCARMVNDICMKKCIKIERLHNVIRMYTYEHECRNVERI